MARLGGDEFAVLLGGDDVHIEGMVARITRDMSRPFDLGEVTLDVMASIGIAATPRDGSSAALLLRRAEIAMYDAKHGLTGVARYAADRDPYSSRRLSLIGDLARAVEEGTLELHYQPQAVPSSAAPNPTDSTTPRSLTAPTRSAPSIPSVFGTTSSARTSADLWVITRRCR